jgi:hypothetical protein
MRIGAPSTRCAFFDRFRVYCWKIQHLAEDEAELGPKYDCQLCQLPQRDLKQDCPRCPLAEARRSFKDEVEEEIKTRFSGWGEWSFEKLQGLYNSVSLMLQTNKNKVNPKWDCAIAGLARVILSERSKARFVRDWNQLQSKH